MWYDVAMNVLLTSSGRRTYLVKYFQEALSGEGLVFASNSCMSPALKEADGSVITPIIYSEEYIPFLLEFCREKKIGLLVPLFDIDLPVLSAHKAEFEKEGVTVAVSDPETIAACNDKYSMYLKLWKHGIRCPETVLSVSDALLQINALSMRYPVIVKPRFGMGSIGVETADNKEELKAFYGHCQRKIRNSYLKYEARSCPDEEVVIQEMREGQEYGLDVIDDLSGNYITTIVKRKSAMRAGETDEAVTLGKEDPEYRVLSRLGEQLSIAFSHIGNLDVDVIMDSGNMAPYVIDMNGRFGGGYPFSHAAGVDLPRAYVAWAKGEKAPKECFTARPGVHCFKDLCIEMYE